MVGGGFGGLNTAKALDGAHARVTLVDRRNHHVFQPLLYQVATAALNPADIAVPIRYVLRYQENVSVIMAEAASVDANAKKLVLTDGELGYDFLVLATGASHSYFGNEQWAAVAPGLKTIEDALDIRRRVFGAFEKAERATSDAARREWLTFLIVGGGPTGVELAGALAEITRHSLTNDFRNIDPAQARILLVEGQPHVLSMFPEALRLDAEAMLAKMGVEVKCSAHVTGIDETGVTVDGERIGARTVLWAAGNKASPLAATLGVPLDRAGRVLVEPDLSIPGHRDVFVIGDLAILTQNGKPISGLAPIAIQQGRHVAQNIRRALRGDPTEAFHYVDRGSFSTIGRGAAVGQIAGRYNATGVIAWLFWLVIHILFLVGFKNRLMVMIEWGFAYLTWQRGSRLITGPEHAAASPPKPV